MAWANDSYKESRKRWNPSATRGTFLGPNILQGWPSILEQFLTCIGDCGDRRDTTFLGLRQGQLAGLIENGPLFLEIASDR